MPSSLSRCMIALSISLVFSAGNALALDAEQLTQTDGQDTTPVLSPDGTRLAFASNRTGDFCIYVMTLGSPGVMQLTQSNDDDHYPAWSPDGSKILFVSKRTGHGDLYEMAADGSTGYLQITDTGDEENQPVYAPKGGAFAFAKQKHQLIRFSRKYSVVIAGGKASANSPRHLADDAWQPQFSPDGTQVLFVCDRTGNEDLWIMGVDGGLQTQLTSDNDADEDPCFSPDGKSIVFASDRTGNYDLWVMNIDGTGKRQLTSDPADERFPCWGKDGKIYFVRSAAEGRKHLYRITAP